MDEALALAARGWYVFPVARTSKAPLTPNGHHDASTDPAQIRRWWERNPDARPGVSLAPSGLIVLDVDVKASKKFPAGAPGMASLDVLMPELPETAAAETPSGGLHLYYQRPADWSPRRVINWRPGLDLLSEGYVVAYPLDEVPLAPAPNLFAGAPELRQERLSGSGADRETPPASPAVLRAAERFLRDHGPAVTGQNGNGHTVQAITKLCWDYALSPEEAWPLLEKWNKTCEPPWDLEGPDSLRYKVEHLYEGEGPRGLARKALELRKAKAPPPAGRIVDLVPAIYADAKLPWVTTPWKSLDEALDGGLPVGSVTYVVAGTGRGKTSFAAQVGTHHAKTMPVVYYMGELSPQKLAARVVAQRTRQPWGDVLRGRVPQEQARRVLEPLDLRVVARSEDPAAAIEAALDACEGGPGPGPVMLVVDYVQLLADEVGEKDLRLSTIAAVRWLTRLTADRGLITVVLSQTSRLTAAHLRADNDIKAEDGVGAAAETSRIENDADNLLTLRIRDDDGNAEILVGKARFRGPSKVGMKFHGSSGLWEERDLEADRVEKQRARLDTIRTTLRRLNEGGVYPSKEMLRKECEVSSKGHWQNLLEDLEDEIQIVDRDPKHHIKLSRPGLFLKTSPKLDRGG
jgi:hypothetical protein